MFANRSTAGIQLARAIEKYELGAAPVVLGLPRGGVPVAYEVAHALRVPLDVMVVRKVGAPGQPELAIGAIALGGILVREPSSGAGFTCTREEFVALAERERAELALRERVYRHGLPPLDLTNRTAILVDDGIATGCTMVAAVRAARRAGARSTFVAVPVASDNGLALVGVEANETLALKIPADLSAVGEYYDDFQQVSDAQVLRLLTRARHEPGVAHLQQAQ
jgi:putative phosphoribosyl transferase